MTTTEKLLGGALSIVTGAYVFTVVKNHKQNKKTKEYEDVLFDKVDEMVKILDPEFVVEAKEESQ